MVKSPGEIVSPFFGSVPLLGVGMAQDVTSLIPAILMEIRAGISRLFKPDKATCFLLDVKQCC